MDERSGAEGVGGVDRLDPIRMPWLDESASGPSPKHGLTWPSRVGEPTSNLHA